MSSSSTPPPPAPRSPSDEPGDSDEQRKPRSIPWHSLADYRIRQAQQEGKFDRIEGFGRPFAWDETPDGEDWWIRRKLHDENLSVVHPLLTIGRRIDEVRREVVRLVFEGDVRDRLEALNREIREAIASPLPAPPIVVLPLDVDTEIERWRKTISRRGGSPDS